MSEFMAKEWLKASKIDLDSIEYIIQAEHLTTVVAFHAQQSLEKALKALLISKDTTLPKIHALNKLFALVKDDLKVEGFEMIDMLDDLYIESRYPGDLGLLPYGQPTLEDAQEFYRFAQNIYKQVCRLLDCKPEAI